MTSLPTYRLRVAGVEYDLSVAGPGLGVETLMTDALRQHYQREGALQARWVTATSVKRVNRSHYLVTSSREDQFVIRVTPWRPEGPPRSGELPAGDPSGIADHP